MRQFKSIQPNDVHLNYNTKAENLSVQSSRIKEAVNSIFTGRASSLAEIIPKPSKY